MAGLVYYSADASGGITGFDNMTNNIISGGVLSGNFTDGSNTINIASTNITISGNVNAYDSSGNVKGSVLLGNSATPNIFHNGSPSYSWNISPTDVTSISSLSGAVNIKILISISPIGGGTTLTGFLSTDLVSPQTAKTFQLAAPPAAYTVEIVGLYGGVEPKKTYVSFGGSGAGATFSDIGYVTYADIVANSAQIILTDTTTSTQTSLAMVGSAPGTTLTGTTLTSGLVSGDVQKISLVYGGITYDTGVTFSRTIDPTFTLGSVTNTGYGQIGSTYYPIFTVDSGSSYADSSTALLTIGTDSGRIVYADTSGVGSSAVQSGTTFMISPNDFPGAAVSIGYQSAFARAFDPVNEYYMPSIPNFILPGITYTNVGATATVGGYAFVFTNLEVFGTSGPALPFFAQNIQLTGYLNGAVTTYNALNLDPAGKYRSATIGVTYDVPAYTYQFVYNGHPSFSVGIPIYLGLTGTITATSISSGVVHVEAINVSYGVGNDTVVLEDTAGLTFQVTSGSGGYTYSGVPAGLFQQTYAVQNPAPLLLSHNTLTTNSLTLGNTSPTTTGSLVLGYVFGATAGQTYSFNILGEAGYTGIAFDQSIQLNVPAAKMSQLIAYSTNWPTLPGSTGSGGTTYYQSEPDVLLALQTVVGPWLDAFTKGLTGTTTGTTYFALLDIVQGDSGTTCADLIKEFQTISGFTYNVNGTASDYLAGIPQEAIGSYSLSNINTVPLSIVVGDLAVNTPYGTTTAATGLSGAIQSLFEQAIAVGMVQPGETLGANLRLNTLFSGLTYGGALGGTTFPVYGASFSAGQSLSMYVRFNLQKNRSYQLQPLADLGTTGATGAAFAVFGGVTFSLPSGLVESSTPVPVVYQIILNAV